jgi:hypothetical protein
MNSQDHQVGIRDQQAGSRVEQGHSLLELVDS